MMLRKKPTFYFGGIDFYGISPRVIKLPRDMPTPGGRITLAYIKRLKQLLKRQIQSYRHRAVRGPLFLDGNSAYLIVEVTDKDYTHLFEHQQQKGKSDMLDRTNRIWYAKWKNALNELWRQNKLYPTRPYERNARRLMKVEAEIREALVKDAFLMANIKAVLSHGKMRDLSIVAMLCHWTPKTDKEIAGRLASLVLHPNQSVRNNASRSLLVNYPDRLPEIDIKKFLKQIQLPFHTDRNKALYILTQYSYLPRYKKILRRYKRYFKEWSMKTMQNIAQPAMDILKNIRVV